MLDRDRYRALLKPSENEPAALFALGDEALYHDILNRCVEPGQTCMDAMMSGGAGHEGGHGGGHQDDHQGGHQGSQEGGHEGTHGAPPADGAAPSHDDSARAGPLTGDPVMLALAGDLCAPTPEGTALIDRYASLPPN